MFDQLSRLGKQLGGDLKVLQIPLRAENWKIGSKALAHQADACSILTPASLVGEHDEEKEAILQGVLINSRSPLLGVNDVQSQPMQGLVRQALTSSTINKTSTPCCTSWFHCQPRLPQKP